MKHQIWLRPDQADLVAACLMYTQQQLNTGTCISDAHKMAGRYTYQRIEEVLALLPEPAAIRASVKEGT